MSAEDDGAFLSAGADKEISNQSPEEGCRAIPIPTAEAGSRVNAEAIPVEDRDPYVSLWFPVDGKLDHEYRKVFEFIQRANIHCRYSSDAHGVQVKDPSGDAVANRKKVFDGFVHGVMSHVTVRSGEKFSCDQRTGLDAWNLILAADAFNKWVRTNEREWLEAMVPKEPGAFQNCVVQVQIASLSAKVHGNHADHDLLSAVKQRLDDEAEGKSLAFFRVAVDVY